MLRRFLFGKLLNQNYNDEDDEDRNDVHVEAVAVTEVEDGCR